MTPLDKLRGLALRQQERIEELEKEAKDCGNAVAAAHTACVRAQQRRLKRRARPGNFVDGVYRWDPNWAAPTEKELDELQDAIESCRAVKVGREEALQAANTAVERAKNWLAEMRRAWPLDFGPFPERDT